MRPCIKHQREDCDECANATKLEDEYDELYCALQALVAQLITSELPVERVRTLIEMVRTNLKVHGLIRAVELTPGLDRVVFGIIEDLLDDTKDRALLRGDKSQAASEGEKREVDYSGCTAIGIGGFHSDDYGESGGRCNWCGAASPVMD